MFFILRLLYRLMFRFQAVQGLCRNNPASPSDLSKHSSLVAERIHYESKRLDWFWQGCVSSQAGMDVNLPRLVDKDMNEPPLALCHMQDQGFDLTKLKQLEGISEQWWILYPLNQS